MLRALIYILPLALTIYAFIDCLNTPEDEVKHLPKVAWIFIILLFWIAGPVVWLVGGRERRARAAGGFGGSFGAGGAGDGDWSRGRRGGGQWVAPDDNPDFLKSLDDDAAARRREPGRPGSGSPGRDQGAEETPGRDRPGDGTADRDQAREPGAGGTAGRDREPGAAGRDREPGQAWDQARDRHADRDQDGDEGPRTR